MARILIIDDERSIRNTLREILELEKYQVDDAKDGEEGLQKLTQTAYDVVLCDIKMPKLDGLEVLERAQELGRETQFIMISGHGTVETALEATQKGAFDFIEKPPDLNRLLVSVRNALDRNSLVAETRTLKKKIRPTQEIVGESEAIRRVKDDIVRAAQFSDARVLILGPNGSGKELVARWVHEHSPRARGPMVEVNCAAIPAELIESELFGHEKGAFTSAVKQRIGKFEQAQGGTLFLDEIGDMSLSAQAKVLRALQEKKITRVGGEKDISVDVRVVAATNKDLETEIRRGQFREDLYHRLGVVVIQVPPLNQRISDVPLLATHFLNLICTEYGIAPRSITPEALEELKKHSWPGNVRELRNVMERLVIFSDQVITERHVRDYAPAQTRRTDEHPLFDRFEHYSEFKEYVEAEFIRRKLQKFHWNVTRTAESMNMQRSHLYEKMEKYSLRRENESGDSHATAD